MIDCVSPGDSLTKETEDVMEVSKSSWSENEGGHVGGQNSGFDENHKESGKNLMALLKPLSFVMYNLFYM